MNPINVDPERMGGTPCFTGTRVPIYNLFDFLERNRDINYFLDAFPTVEREQVIAVLNMARAAVIPPSRRPEPVQGALGVA